MARLGVVHKLWLSFLALIIVVLLPAGVALDRGITRFYYEENTRSMLDLGRRFAGFLVRASEPGAEQAARIMAELVGTPLLVVDRDGVVTTGTGRLAERVGETLATPQVERALAGAASVILSVDPALPGGLIVAAVPVSAAGEVQGAVLLFREAGAVRQAIGRARTLLYLAAGALLLLFTALTWSLSRRLARPLLAMRDTADRMARGEYDARVAPPSRDELGELARAINRLGESLHALETGRRAFFANVSHELRTPLSYLRGYSEALADDLARSEEEVREYGRILSEESRRLSRLVEDLFELAQAEEGRLALEIGAVDLAEPVRRMVERVQPEAEKRGIAIHTELGDGLFVLADRDRLEQILLNLLDNALRHTPRGGTVRVEAHRGPLGKGGPEPDAPGVTLSVEDSGPGFEEEIDRIWHRFYRGDARSSARGTGSGLGLAIVKGLVEAQGGAVEAGKSPALGGARVSVTLPAAPRP